jgi:putative ABC transport system permease protein
VLLVTLNVERAMKDTSQRLAFYERAREAVRSLPGVADAAVSLVTPVNGVRIDPPIEVSGAAWLPEHERKGFVNFVSPGWFGTFGTALLAGRAVTDGDRRGAPPVVIVNQALARKFLNGADPLGHTIATISGPTARSTHIVGVVADAVYASLREPAPPSWYVPLAQFDGPPFLLGSVTLSVRAMSDSPVLLTKSVAAAIGAVDPGVALTFRPLTEQINASLTQERVVAMLAGFFGTLALWLAALGLYGVASYTVSRRRKEIAIRMAVGATPMGVVRLVLGQMTILVGIGMAVGGCLSVWASPVVATLMYGLEPRDTLTLIGAVGTLAGVGVLASGFPAWRGSRIDPADVLRQS